MKKTFCILCIILFACSCSKGKDSAQGTASPGRITISGAWALHPLVVRWAEEYRKQHPDIIIDISAGGSGKGMADVLSGAADLGMVSREIQKAETDRGAWCIAVSKDAVVPIMNDANPLREDLLKRGMTRKEFTELWITGKLTLWNALVRTGKEYPVHLYTRSDACGTAETWAAYVGGTQEDLKGIGSYGDPGLADAVRNDLLGIGFTNVNFAYDAKTRKPVTGFRPVPLDINGSGKIEPDEDFYSDCGALLKAISENRYPSPPARNLHLVSRGVPEKQQVRDFLFWIVGEGQRYVSESGYIRLTDELLKKQAELLTKKK